MAAWIPNCIIAPLLYLMGEQAVLAFHGVERRAVASQEGGTGAVLGHNQTQCRGDKMLVQKHAD